MSAVPQQPAANDPDSLETQEWLEALEAVLEREGPERAHFLIERLIDKARLKGGSVEEWSREMWGEAKALAYATLVGDPCGEVPAGRPALSEDEVRALIPDVRADIQRGGLRLARLLDDALGPERKAPGQKKR